MLMLRLMNALYLDGYKSLWDKYHDPYREIYQKERHWAYENYKEYFRRAFRAHDFTTCMILRKAKRQWDYITLYNIMVDMDNDLDAIITI